MLPYDIAERLSLSTLPENTLSNFSFDDGCQLWSKDPHSIPQVATTLKRYRFIKYGKVLGFEVIRYLCIYQNCLFYSEQPLGAFKGHCQLKNRYVEWHHTTTGRHLLLISNSRDTSLLFFEDCSFWDEKKEEIVQTAIRTNYCQEYNELQQLGQGSFSIVYAVKNRHNGKIYAAKKINKLDRHNKPTKKIVTQQRRILTSLKDYPHTSQLLQFYQQNNQYVMIIQKMEGTDLLTFIKDNPEPSLERIKSIITSILTCLKDLHERRIIHRDIKPQNIHIDGQQQCRILDFGLSLNTNTADKSSFRKCGTIGYMAPQVFLNEFSFIRPYNSKCDLFSFGIVVHMLLMGSNPIKGKTYEQTYELNRQCKIVLNRSKIISKYGAQCLYFMQRLLQPNARERFNAEEALSSSFLQSQEDSSNQISRKLSTSTLDQKRKLSEQFFHK